MVILGMDFIQFTDLIRQTGYIILVLILVGSVISSLQTISIRKKLDNLTPFRFFRILFIYTVLYVVFFVFLISLFAILYNVILMYTQRGDAFF